MKKFTTTLAALLTAITLAACGSSGGGESAKESGDTKPTEESSKPAERTLDDIVAAIEDVPTVTNAEALTEDTDKNELLGRQDGYTDAIVFTDKSGVCPSDGPGVDCGAVLEVWPTADAAKARADYIKSVTKDLPMLADGWHYFDDGYLLRISKKVKPSDAAEYKAAFEG